MNTKIKETIKVLKDQGTGPVDVLYIIKNLKDKGVLKDE